MWWLIGAAVVLLILSVKPKPGGGQGQPPREGVYENPATKVIKVVNTDDLEQEIIWPANTYEDKAHCVKGVRAQVLIVDGDEILGEVGRAFSDQIAKWSWNDGIFWGYNFEGDTILNHPTGGPCICPDGLFHR
jgi:hypothetical protein